MSARVDDHVEQAKSLLVAQFQGKERLEGLLTTFVLGVQELENVFYEIGIERSLADAEGVQLDAHSRAWREQFPPRGARCALRPGQPRPL